MSEHLFYPQVNVSHEYTDNPAARQRQYTWGDQAPIAEHIARLDQTVRYGGHTVPQNELDKSKAELNNYRDEHALFLGGIIEAAESQVAQKGSGYVEQTLEAGSKSYFAFRAGKPETRLDLEGLGMPALEKEDLIPMAVAVHEQPDKQGKEVIELLAFSVRDKSIKHRYLESPRAAVDATDKNAAPKWVGPGEIILSNRDFPGRSNLTEITIGEGKDTSMMVAKLEDYGRKSEPVKVIRPVPNKAERLAEKHDKPPKKSRVKQAIMGSILMAGAAFMSNSELDNAEKVTTAQEMVLPNGSFGKDGTPQAEQFYDEPVLERSRQAFEAYFEGDYKALQDLKEQHGFQSNWIDAKTVENIKNASDYTDIESAFDHAFKKAGVPVSLTLETNQKDVDKLSHRSIYNYTPLSDMQDAKRMAINLVNVWNVLDKRQLAGIKPLHYSLVDSIDPQSNKKLDPAGYYSGSKGQTEDIIVIEAGAHEDVAQHENAHYWDLQEERSKKSNPQASAIGSGVLSNRITNFNPKGHVYVGMGDPDKYKTTSVIIDGKRVVAEQYGNTNQREDLATASEPVFAPKPALEFEHSPLGEKQSAIIFAMEQEQPGFTAAMLERMSPQVTSKGILKDIVEFRDDHLKLPLTGATLMLMAGTLVSVFRRKITQSFLKRYGLAGDKPKR